METGRREVRREDDKQKDDSGRGAAQEDTQPASSRSLTSLLSHSVHVWLSDISGLW